MKVTSIEEMPTTLRLFPCVREYNDGFAFEERVLFKVIISTNLRVLEIFRPQNLSDLPIKRYSFNNNRDAEFIQIYNEELEYWCEKGYKPLEDDTDTN